MKKLRQMNGTQLLSVNSSGVYDILSKNDGGNLNTDDISTKNINYRNPKKIQPLAEQMSQFQLVNGKQCFCPKVETGLTQK